MCVKKFKNEIKNEIKKKIKNEIENNDLIKINLCLKKSKMNIKKRYNDFIIFHVFYNIEFSRI